MSKKNKTIAQKLNASTEMEITVAMVIARGGVKTNADFSQDEYKFPDGSKCWICPAHGAFFDFGEGCCLPE